MDIVTDARLIARFMAKVTVSPSGCWEWQGEIMNSGYGRFAFKGRTRTMAHRASYLLFVGPIPEGYFVLHRCDHPRCVRPEHLFTGTAVDNMQDMLRKGRGHSPSGEAHWTHRHPELVARGFPKVSGEAHPRAKLTALQVRDIRRRYASEGITHQALANEYGLDKSTIGDIIRRKRWRHLPD